MQYLESVGLGADNTLETQCPRSWRSRGQRTPLDRDLNERSVYNLSEFLGGGSIHLRFWRINQANTMKPMINGVQSVNPRKKYWINGLIASRLQSNIGWNMVMAKPLTAPTAQINAPPSANWEREATRSFSSSIRMTIRWPNWPVKCLFPEQERLSWNDQVQIAKMLPPRFSKIPQTQCPRFEV